MGRQGLRSPLAICWRDALLALCVLLLAILCDPVKYEILTVMTYSYLQWLFLLKMY